MELDTLKPLYNKLNAQFRKEVITVKIIPWRKYVSSLSSDNPIQKIWEKFRKINGHCSTSSRYALISNGRWIIDTYEISNILGDNFQQISSNTNLDVHFRDIKSSAERRPLNFETAADIYYNKKFTMVELEFALSLCNNSAPFIDNICFDMTTHLPLLAK